jgi:hypothetical protein
MNMLPSCDVLQSVIAPAIMPSAAFVAVPRLPPPSFECRVLRPVGMTGLSTYSSLQMNQDDENENSDQNSIQHYQDLQYVASSA